MTGRKRKRSHQSKKNKGEPALSPTLKRRGVSLKNPPPAAAAVKWTEEEWQETDDRLLAITKTIMFAAGDCSAPDEANARMLLALMQQQVRMIMDAAMKNAEADGRDEIVLRDILMHMTHHKMVLARLLNHAKVAHEISSINRQMREENEAEEREEDGVPHAAEVPMTSDDDDARMSEDSDSDQPCRSLKRAPKMSTLAQIETAIDSLHAGFLSSDLVDPSFTDLTRDARMKRIVVRVQRFGQEAYDRFTEARQATYVSRTRVKKIDGVSEGVLFLSWLGLPPLDNIFIYVLSWLAKEVVTQVVDDAYVHLLKELTSGVMRTRGSAADLLLSASHYEEALRKNLGWREREDVLFGYIALRE